MSNLSRNVNEDHLREIFGNYGKVKEATLAIDKAVGLPKGYAYIEFASERDAESAITHLHGGQIDGNAIKVEHQSDRKKAAAREPAPRAPAAAARREPDAGRGRAAPGRGAGDRDRDRDRGRSRDRGRDAAASRRDGDHKDRGREKERQKERERAADREKDRAKEKDKDREREKDRHKEKDDDKKKKDREEEKKPAKEKEKPKEKEMVSWMKVDGAGTVECNGLYVEAPPRYQRGGDRELRRFEGPDGHRLVLEEGLGWSIDAQGARNLYVHRNSATAPVPFSGWTGFNGCRPAPSVREARPNEVPAPAAWSPIASASPLAATGSSLASPEAAREAELLEREGCRWAALRTELNREWTRSPSPRAEFHLSPPRRMDLDQDLSATLRAELGQLRAELLEERDQRMALLAELDRERQQREALRAGLDREDGHRRGSLLRGELEAERGSRVAAGAAAAAAAAAGAASSLREAALRAELAAEQGQRAAAVAEAERLKGVLWEELEMAAASAEDAAEARQCEAELRAELAAHLSHRPPEASARARAPSAGRGCRCVAPTAAGSEPDAVPEATAEVDADADAAAGLEGMGTSTALGASEAAGCAEPEASKRCRPSQGFGGGPGSAGDADFSPEVAAGPAPGRARSALGQAAPEWLSWARLASCSRRARSAGAG